MKRTAVVLAALVGLVLPAVALAKGKKQAQSKPSNCVKFSQADSDGGKTVTFKLENACTAELRCSMAWKTTCTRLDSVSTTSRDESALVGAGFDRLFVASVTDCDGEGVVWEISAPSWSCKAPSTDVAKK
jgi:hypothetical protein